MHAVCLRKRCLVELCVMLETFWSSLSKTWYPLATRICFCTWDVANMIEELNSNLIKLMCLKLDIRGWWLLSWRAWLQHPLWVNNEVPRTIRQGGRIGCWATANELLITQQTLRSVKQSWHLWFVSFAWYILLFFPFCFLIFKKTYFK